MGLLEIVHNATLTAKIETSLFTNTVHLPN